MYSLSQYHADINSLAITICLLVKQKMILQDILMHRIINVAWIATYEWPHFT